MWVSCFQMSHSRLRPAAWLGEMYQQQQLLQRTHLRPPHGSLPLLERPGVEGALGPHRGLELQPAARSSPQPGDPRRRPRVRRGRRGGGGRGGGGGGGRPGGAAPAGHPLHRRRRRRRGSPGRRRAAARTRVGGGRRRPRAGALVVLCHGSGGWRPHFLTSSPEAETWTGDHRTGPAVIPSLRVQPSAPGWGDPRRGLQRA